MAQTVKKDRPQNVYAVSRAGRNVLHIQAATGEQAKRRYCKQYGIRPGDYWCGISTLTARKMKPEEVLKWEAEAEADRDTLVFLRRMLEIGAKASAERGLLQ